MAVNYDRKKRPTAFNVRMIGRIRTPFVETSGTPIQTAYSCGAEGEVLVEEPFAAALNDIEGFERLWLTYWMDRATEFRPCIMPYRDTQARGLFATRSPCRPDPIGMSVVRLVRRDGRVLHVADLDILDGTPLVDLKPYVPAFDAHPRSRAGWFDTSNVDRQVADDRFHDPERRRRQGE